MAELVAESRGGGEGRPDRTDRVLRQLGDLDRALYGVIAETATPELDEPLRRLSDAASYSKLWIGIAGGLAVVGGTRGRRAASSGLAAIAVTSALVNQGIKRWFPRQRPDRDGEEVPLTRRVEMPNSTSFPSGHSASGFAFATAVGSELPMLGRAMSFLAAAVAYSRVHTGVHYPGDVVVGSLIGAGIGNGAAIAARRFR